MTNVSSIQPGLAPCNEDDSVHVPVVPIHRLRKPEWIRSRIPGKKNVRQIIATLRENRLHTVCEEANCPNLGECFDQRTATFLIMGAVCTRRCPFCDIGHGRPLRLDAEEPRNLAQAVAGMRLEHVVITSVNRDDLRDGASQHFTDCIRRLNLWSCM